MHTSVLAAFRPYSNNARSRVQLEPPCTDPYARWCGRGRPATDAPMPIHFKNPLLSPLLSLLRIVDEAQFLTAFRRIRSIRDADRIGPGVLALQIHGIFGHVAAAE